MDACAGAACSSHWGLTLLSWALLRHTIGNRTFYECTREHDESAITGIRLRNNELSAETLTPCTMSGGERRGGATHSTRARGVQHTDNIFNYASVSGCHFRIPLPHHHTSYAVWCHTLPRPSLFHICVRRTQTDDRRACVFLLHRARVCTIFHAVHLPGGRERNPTRDEHAEKVFTVMPINLLTK